MILSVQRVRAPSGIVGINTFHFAQHNAPEQTDADLDTPGIVVWEHRMVPGSGNRVLSFVDIALSPASSWDVIEDALLLLLEEEQMPTEDIHTNNVAFRVGMESSFLPLWKEEVMALVTHLFKVYP